ICLPREGGLRKPTSTWRSTKLELSTIHYFRQCWPLESMRKRGFEKSRRRGCSLDSRLSPPLGTARKDGSLDFV
ncbi:MAG: hypothetical protein ABEJ72_09755, partial [Candidatus Aenigmatarchaeota archaeon]